MKLVLFAHVPPPVHGQSLMVRQLLDFLGGAMGQPGSPDECALPPVACYHVDARFSATLADIGRSRPGKLLLLFQYVARAWHHRWRHGADCFLHVPAPAKCSALVRDWLVMLLCRPCFRRRVCWFQAAGLADWLECEAAPWQRWLTRTLLGRPDLSIVLGEWGRRDAEALGSCRIVVVPNTVPDPCPPDAAEILRSRAARVQARVRRCGPTASVAAPEIDRPDRFRLLFLSLCTRQKGLFDAMEGTILVNRRLVATGSPLRVELAVAGEFPQAAEREEFEQCCRSPEWLDAAGRPLVRYCGFVVGEAKDTLLRESDCLCFPTYYSAEGFPLVLVEAMAWGLPIITTRWRIIPELFPDGYDGLVEPQQPAQIADAIERLLLRPPASALRRRYEERYAVEPCLGKIRQVLLELEAPPLRPARP